MTVVDNRLCALSVDDNQHLNPEELEILNSVFSNVLNGAERQSASVALLKHFGAVRKVLSAPDDQLQRIVGLPELALHELQKTRRIVRCILKSGIRDRPLLDKLDEVRKFSRAMLTDKGREEFHALFLDESYYLLAHECLQIGTVNHVAIYPREIMCRALVQNASHLILIHNHPGGSERPSKQDIEVTKLLAESAFFLNISILDHIIIGRNADFSFRQNGLMN